MRVEGWGVGNEAIRRSSWVPCSRHPWLLPSRAGGPCVTPSPATQAHVPATLPRRGKQPLQLSLAARWLGPRGALVYMGMGSKVGGRVLLSAVRGRAQIQLR